MKTFPKVSKIVLSAALILSIAGFAFADPEDDSPFDDRPFGRSYGGMMGGGMMGGRSTGPGMMGRGYTNGNMMGGCVGDGSYIGFPGGERLNMEDVEKSIDEFIRNNRLDDIEVAEVMEFDQNFYAQLVESDSGIGALEVLIDPFTGFVSAEPGPNMMWNTKYGHMGGWSRTFDRSMRIDEKEAVESAQEYLDYYKTDLVADDHADRFYGYYTLHVLEGNEIVGMLSVNGFDGRVWYHNWHGDFLGMDDHD